MIIAIDFDGTCVTHEFPKVGKDINAVPVLKALVENGHQLVLFTMRSDIVNPTGEVK
jgi:hydroxymethylpyrimidine pyrophosphatase-like HAD family hydrolase